MNLFGEDFLIDVQENTVKDLVKKLSGKNGEEVSSEKLLKSKKLTLEERLNIITDKVLKTFDDIKLLFPNIQTYKIYAKHEEYIPNDLKISELNTVKFEKWIYTE